MGIARKVASEKGKLYTAFSQSEIQKLLLLVELSAKALLSADVTDPTGYHYNNNNSNNNNNNTEAVAMEG